jgi:hypothetical protein
VKYHSTGVIDSSRKYFSWPSLSKYQSWGQTSKCQSWGQISKCQSWDKYQSVNHGDKCQSVNHGDKCQSIKYKLLNITYKIIQGRAQTYLRQCIRHLSGPRQTRSTSSKKLHVNRTGGTVFLLVQQDCGTSCHSISCHLRTMSPSRGS